jgi:hypothetical protein
MTHNNKVIKFGLTSMYRAYSLEIMILKFMMDGYTSRCLSVIMVSNVKDDRHSRDIFGW